MTNNEIADKSAELFEEWLTDSDFAGLKDATTENAQLLWELLNAPLSELSDARLDLLKGLEKYANSQRDFMGDAKDYLESQYGFWKKISEDDERFVAHAQG
jgi:hypothetical protein